MANTTFSNLELYGKQYNIGVANTYGTNVLTCQNLAEASVIIAAPGDGRVDTGVYSLLATDSYGHAARLTYTIRGSYHGIDTTTDKDVMQLNIDEHSIKSTEPLNSEDNTLYVDSREIVDNFTIKTKETKFTYQLYVSADSLTGTPTSTGVTSTDNPTLEAKNYTDSTYTYLNVITQNLELPKKSESSQGEWDIPGVVKLDGDSIVLNDNGEIEVNFASLTDGFDDTDVDITRLSDKQLITYTNINGNTSLTVVEDNLRHASSSDYGVMKNDGLTSILNDGVLSVDASLLSYGSTSQCGVFKIDGNTIKTKTITQTVRGKIVNRTSDVTFSTLNNVMGSAAAVNSIAATLNMDVNKVGPLANRLLIGSGLSYNSKTGDIKVSQKFINNMDSTLLGASDLQTTQTSPYAYGASYYNKATITIPKTSNLYNTILNTKLTSTNNLDSKLLGAVGAVLPRVLPQRINVQVNTGALYVDTNNLQKADTSYYGVVRLSNSGALYLNSSGDIDVDSRLIDKSTTTDYGVIKYDGTSLLLNDAGQLCVNSYVAMVQQIMTLLDTVNGLQIRLAEAEQNIIQLSHSVNNVTTTTSFTQNGVSITSISMSITSGTDLYQTQNINVTTTKSWLFTANSPDADWIRSTSMIFTDEDGKRQEFFGQSVIEQITNKNVILKVYVNSFVTTTKMERRGTLNISIFDANTINGVAESSAAVYKFTVIIQQSSVVLLPTNDIRQKLWSNYTGLISQYTQNGTLGMARPPQTLIEGLVKETVNTNINTVYEWKTVNDILHLASSDADASTELTTHDSVNDMFNLHSQFRHKLSSLGTWLPNSTTTGVYYNSSKTHLSEYTALYGLILLYIDNPTVVNQLYDVITTNYWYTTPVYRTVVRPVRNFTINDGVLQTTPSPSTTISTPYTTGTPA